jgi:hypothetical protein
LSVFISDIGAKFAVPIKKEINRIASAGDKATLLTGIQTFLQGTKIIRKGKSL